MKSIRHPKPRFFLYCIAASLGLVISSVYSQERPHGSHSDPKAEIWSKLSKEEQEKIRAALRAVWSDPEVLSAREDVNRSTAEFQEAIRKSIENQSPETARILKRLHQLAPSTPGPNGHGRKGSGLHAAGLPRGAGWSLELLPPPQIWDNMSPDEKKQFRKAAEAARGSSGVASAREELGRIRKEDDKIRRKKFEAFRKYRRAYFDAMIESDPSLKSRLEPIRDGKSTRKRPDNAETSGPPAKRNGESSTPPRPAEATPAQLPAANSPDPGQGSSGTE